jgi:DNA ligase (NAD+)
MNLEELESEIRTAAEAYYSGNPSISDDEFDALLEELRAEAPGNELLTTIAYGYDPAKDMSGEKVAHKYMNVGSLNKINAETCNKYFEKRPGQYCITSKIDGGSVVCYYGATGKLERAVTRGNGTIGIDCTSKLKHIVPRNVTLSNVAVRGEIIMTKKNFEENYPNAASPRNTALGIIGQDNPSIEEVQLLSFVAYNVYGDNPLIPKKKSEKMAWLYENGFTIVQYTKLFDRSPRFLESMKGKLSPEFPSDGLVITNELNPDEEIAYKFVAETAETTVTKVEWETSRLGSVIPVVHFNPVKLSGARLEKCSGFNAKWVLANALGRGSKIIVHRAGEVIPYITEIKSAGNFEVPTNCPDCNSELIWIGVHICCVNETCSKKVQSNLLHWIEKMAPVDSLGENILIPFIYNMGWKSVSDIYNSSEANWRTQFNFIPVTMHACDLLWQMYNKLYKDPVNPDKFFAAFGLPAVGETVSKMISKEMGLEQFFYTPLLLPNLNKIKFSRTITKPAIKALEENYEIMYEVYYQIMEQQGFIEKETSKMKIKVAITGKLSKPRKELIEEFASHKIEVVDSVGKECSYLITDDPASGSSKNVAAEKLGIVVISESDFRDKLGIT